MVRNKLMPEVGTGILERVLMSDEFLCCIKSFVNAFLYYFSVK